MDELADRLGTRSPGVPPSQRAARRRHDGDRPDARRIPPASPSASTRCGRTGSRRMTRWRPSTPTRRRASGAASASAACGTASATPRCRTPRACAIGLSPDGTLTLYSGAVDIGQGSNTILTQIAADALGLPAAQVALVTGDTDLTADAGKTSASRQTFVSGNGGASAPPATCASRSCAWPMPGRTPRCCSTGASLDGARWRRGSGHRSGRARASLMGEGSFDPPTTPLDANGQGVPYATYALRRPDGDGRGRHRARHGEGAAHRGGARCRQGDQPDPGRGPDPRRHRPGARAWR